MRSAPALRRRARSLAAEFVLIVVGVLLALWVDSWRQGVEDAAREAELLRAIQADLTADSLFLEGQLESLPREIRAAHGLLQLDPDDLPSTDSIDRLDAAFAIMTPDGWSESAYRSMLESGELASVRDPALARVLTRYYEDVLRRARIRARLDQQALDWQMEAMWLQDDPFALTDTGLDELLSEGNTAWAHQIDRAGYGDWLASNASLIVFRMDQRLAMLRHFRTVEEDRAVLNRRITDYLSSD